MVDIITVGTATRDVFLRSDLFRFVRDPEHLRKIGFPSGEAECFALGGKIDIEEPVFTIGGGAANAAVTFARQGLRVMCVAKVGEDAVGREIEGDLRAEKVRPALFRDAKRGTAYSTLLLSPQGERTALVHRGASEDMTDRDLASITEKVSWIYIVPGTISLPVMLKFARRMKESGSSLFINPSAHYLAMGLKKLKPLFALMDIVMVNRDEAAALTGVPLKQEDKIFKVFDEHIEGLAIMTDGADGVSVSDGTTIFQAGVFPKYQIVDRTGAGDAFGSGFVAALAKVSGAKYEVSSGLERNRRFANEDIEAAIRLGSANATSVIEFVGAQEGILTVKKFSEPRWKRLPIMKRPTTS